MKNFIIGISILLITTFTAKAQTYTGSVSLFTVNSGWNVVPNSANTTVNFKVSLVREQIQVNGSWGWAPFNMNLKVGIALAPGSAVIEYLSPTYNVTSSNFSTNNSIYDATFSFIVPSAKLQDDHHLVLYYNIPSNGNTSYQNYGGTQINNPPPGPVIDQSHLNAIQSRGFSTVNVINYDSNYYLVEGDVLIKKSSLNATNNFFVNNDYEHNINIVVSGSVRHSSWFGAIYNAIGAWNAMPNSDIKFHFILDGQNPPTRRDIYIDGDSNQFPATLAALTEFPNGDGKPGGLIRVNLDFGTNILKMKNHIIHSLAHAVGIKHYENTPSIMRSSIMTQANTTSYSSTFPVQEDSQIINTLYPFNANSNVIAYISGLENLYFNGGDVFLMSYYANHMPQHLGYEWKTVEPQGNEFLWTNEFGFGTQEIGFPTGSFNLRCTLIDPKYSNPIVATKHLTVQ